MEEASPVKPSVAELAGKFKGHVLSMPKNEERKAVRTSPPCCLKLQNQTDGESEQEKAVIVPSYPSKVKVKNSPLIEKLQANLALTPTGLLTSPKPPETKLQVAPLSPISPCGSLSPTLRPPQQHSEDEMPVSFEQPAEGTLLPHINKSRVRLSFKRRPPTRQHRKSAGEETLVNTHSQRTSPCDLHSPDKNGDVGEMFSAPLEGTEDDLKDSTHLPMDHDTDKQGDVGHDGDVSQDNGENEVLQEEEEKRRKEAGGGEESSKPQDSDPVENQREERQSDDEEKLEEMDGVEEDAKLQPTDGNDELKETSDISGE